MQPGVDVPRERAVYDGPIGDGTFAFSEEDGDFARQLAEQATPPAKRACICDGGWLPVLGAPRLIDGQSVRPRIDSRPCAHCNPEGRA